MFAYVNARGIVINTSPSLFTNTWKANEKTNKKAICLRLFNYLINDTFVSKTINKINKARAPSKIKLLNGIKKVKTIKIIKPINLVLGSNLCITLSVW